MKKVVSYLAVLVVSLFTFVSITNAYDPGVDTSETSKNEEVTTIGEITTNQRVEKYRHITKIGNIDISKGKKVIYVGRAGCGYCQLFVPGLKNLSEKYGFTYDYVDTDVVSDSDLDIWLEKLNVDPTEFGTPTFGVFENGVLKESNVGFVPEEDLFNFLQKNGIIDSSAKYEKKYKNIKFIKDEDYLKIIESNKKSLILLSQYTCSTCISAQEYLDELVTELKVDINYYDLAFSTQEDFDKFRESNDYIKKSLEANTLATPTFIVLKGKDTMAVLTEFSGKEDVKAFIKDYLIGNKVQPEFVKPMNYKLIAIITSILLVCAILVIIIDYVKIKNLKAEISNLKSSNKSKEKEAEKVVKETVKESTKEKETKTKKITAKTTNPKTTKTTKPKKK